MAFCGTRFGVTKSLMRSIALTFLILIFGGLARAETLLSKSSISITGVNGQAQVSDLNQWSHSSSKNSQAVCAQVIEIPGTILCAFRNSLEMNNALLRIGFFTGTAKGYNVGTLISKNDPFYQELLSEVGGHTFTIQEAQAFYSQAFANSDKTVQLNPQELDFYSNLINNPILRSGSSKISIIGFPIDGFGYKTVIRHEINHAKFYLDSAYQAAVVQFWNSSITSDDKEKIAKQLSDIYNINNEKIVIDEFQAYLMEGESQQNPLNSFIGRYKNALLELIQSSGAHQIGELKL